MIKFHYHTARIDVPRMDVRKGDRLCHVYSDESVAELREWGRRHGLEPERIDRGHDLPHFDLAVEPHEEILGPGVERAELVEDIRSWRRRGG